MEINSPTQDDKLVERSPPPGKPPAEGMVWIPGGTFLMGSDSHYPEEAPAHNVSVNGFWMDRYAGDQRASFARFVEATGYVTLAERPANAADYPGAKPEMLVPSSVVFRKTAGPVDLRNHHNWWTYVRGRRLAASARPGQLARGPMDASGGARRLRGRRGLRDLGGQGAADRSRVGVRRAGGLEGAEYAWGDEFMPGGKSHGQHLAGRVPVAEPAERRLRVDRAGRLVPAERLRPVRDGRQRLGVDDRLVSRSTARSSSACCTLDNPRGGEREQSYDPRAARHAHPAQGDEGRLVPLRAELLPALPAGGAHGAADRHVDVPPRLPLHRARVGLADGAALEDLPASRTTSHSLIEALALLVIAIGAVEAAIGIFRAMLPAREQCGEARPLARVRALAGRGLTFQLAADIVHTTVTPGWDEIGRVAAIAAIRTFLTFFLDRDIELEYRRTGESNAKRS